MTAPTPQDLPANLGYDDDQNLPEPDDIAEAHYSAFELDFMISLRETEAGVITRKQLGLIELPEDAADYVRSAVASGLFARRKVEGTDGKWALNAEGQVIASTLTSADRWLGFALMQGDALHPAYAVKADESVLLLDHEELDTFSIRALTGPSVLPDALATIAYSFLSERGGRTVSLRRTDASNPEIQVQLMLHTDEDGTWKLGHEPVKDDGNLTITPMSPEDVPALLTAFWESGASAPLTES
ncbi:hypothetical protein [Devriesea agamarum]|uniref:hypothetical protein n=1 Tax=Devriesea agamarum TaxID=472569 RepID=UPI00071C2281|nr:hypothetical protein [Devriesea agamarum]